MEPTRPQPPSPLRTTPCFRRTNVQSKDTLMHAGRRVSEQAKFRNTHCFNEFSQNCSKTKYFVLVQQFYLFFFMVMQHCVKVRAISRSLQADFKN